MLLYNMYYCSQFTDNMVSMLYRIKAIPADFQVDEVLDIPWNAQGEFMYVCFRKIDMNTMDVIKHLINRLHIDRHILGISGLKDKKAITTQRLSIHALDVQEAGGSEQFIAVL